MALFDKLKKKKDSSAGVEKCVVPNCPKCGGAINRGTQICTACGWDGSICPHAVGFNPQTQLYEKCDVKSGNNVCSENPYSYLFEDCPIYISSRRNTEQPASDGNSDSVTILTQYREGLRYLDSCGIFDETKLREFNRIIGNRFSEAEIQTQLANAQMMVGGMNALKELLHNSTLEGINAFEKVEQSGIDLSKYNI